MSMLPIPTRDGLKAELEANEQLLRDYVCPACDWLGSPKRRPDACPECGETSLETITHE